MCYRRASAKTTLNLHRCLPDCCLQNRLAAVGYRQADFVRTIPGEKVTIMSIESLGQLENKLQNLIDKLELTRMELEELRSTNTRLEDENTHLKQELSSWSERVGSLLGKLDSVSDEAEEVAYEQA